MAGIGSGAACRRASGVADPGRDALVYTYVTTGHLFNPGYEYLYRHEAGFYPSSAITPTGPSRISRYLAQNLPSC